MLVDGDLRDGGFVRDGDLEAAAVSAVAVNNEILDLAQALGGSLHSCGSHSRIVQEAF